MKLRIASLALLTILCLALAASAGTAFYNDGAIDGNDNAFFISGPNFPNPAGSVQDISNGFVSGASGSRGSLEFGEWIASGIRPSSISYELGTSAFGTDLGSATVALNASNSHFLFSNSFGYDIYDVTIGLTPAALTAGNTYWLSLSNATDAGNSGTEAWDLPNGGSGGPATCNFRQSGTNFGDCGLGGEAFTLDGCCVPPVPEPGSILLFGSGILGLAGVLRRKLNI